MLPVPKKFPLDSLRDLLNTHSGWQTQ